jgi:hypothetical protein
LFGFYPALVTSTKDPLGQGRVKVKLPWSPDGGGDSYEVWARRLAVYAADPNRNIWFLPLPNDEVLVGFEEGDPRSPFVIGALLKDGPGSFELHDNSGNVITLDSSGVTLHASTNLLVRSGGDVITLDSSGVSVRAAGDVITLNSSGVNVRAAARANPRQSPSVVSKRETELLGRINAGLSEPQARRLEALDARRKEETLTPEEHAELLGLVDVSERLAVGRAEALVELARLRGATVRSLMSDLGLGVAGRL